MIDPCGRLSPIFGELRKTMQQSSIFLKRIFMLTLSVVTDPQQNKRANCVWPSVDPDFDDYRKRWTKFSIGDVTITALHNWAYYGKHHLPASRCAGKDRAIFSGDTLFLGDVGRPDLAQKKDVDTGAIEETLDSLRNKIMPLADDITVYPAHGAGSACGKKMMKETVDTL